MLLRSPAGRTLRIERITLREVRLRLREPFAISSGAVQDRRILLLQLGDPEGRTAWSECVAGESPHYGPETIDTAWLALREWAVPRVLGCDFRHPHEVRDVLERDFRGHPMAKAALEMGAWGLAAEIEGVSLARLLGGTRSHVAAGISLGIQESPGRLVEKARAALRRGYRRIKMKVKPGADVEYVGAVREALGPAAPLSVDANSAYGLDLLEPLQALDRLGLAMIEQPLGPDDLLRHAQLQSRLATPICLDESITSVGRVEDMIALGSGRIVNIKPGRVGGLTTALEIQDLCRRHGVAVWCGGMLESGVGRAYNVALASLPHFVLPGDLSPSERYWERDIVIPEWTMDAHGRVAVPLDRPGIGVELERDRVEALTVRAETVGG